MQGFCYHRCWRCQSLNRKAAKWEPNWPTGPCLHVEVAEELLLGRGNVMSDAGAQPPKRQRWYAHADSKVYGPYDKATIAGMIERSQLLRDDEVHIEGGSAWISAESEPTLGPLFLKHSAPIAEPPISRQRSWARLIAPVLALLIMGWIAWPYYAVFSLADAVQTGDISTLERRVDWTGVRQALRGDLNARLLKNFGGKKVDASDAMATGFAAMLGPAVINNLIDGYVTPQAIAAFSRKAASPAPTDNGASSNNLDKAISQVRRTHWEHVKYAFFSGGPFSFVVDILPPNDPPLKAPINLVFHWNGDWRLVKVNLPHDVSDGSLLATGAGGAIAQKGLLDQRTDNSDQTQPKPSEPSPVEVILLSKTFKAANYKADNDFKAAVRIELSITNKTTQSIRAFDGVLTFMDLLDNDIYFTKLAINDPVGAGATIKWNGSMSYNQFMEADQRLKNAEQANIKTKFVPRKILYADGNMKMFD
jgi:hypothetical protein